MADVMADGRLLLTIKDAPFLNPILARFASDGALKMLAYLVLLNDPVPPPFIGIEEPENFLHPRLLHDLAEACRASSARGQLLVTTHSPFFIDALRPTEVRSLYRDEHGYTQVMTASDMPAVKAFVEQGALLGQLWLENQFGVGDPLTNHGAPVRRHGGES
jgi:predicted ATPase